ncbi:MAG: DUF6691 family protein [Stenotrophobium sp.]
MTRYLGVLASSILFGLGLAMSSMIDPAKVIGFLDVAGHWDPTLAFVMGGAVLVGLPLFPLVLRRERPLLESRFRLPATTAIDRRLIAGAAIFGIGWGMVGICPGPGFAGLVSGVPLIALFVAAMLGGMGVYRLLHRQ